MEMLTIFAGKFPQLLTKSSIGNAGMSAYILFMCAVFEPGDSDSASVHLAGYDYAVMPFP